LKGARLENQPTNHFDCFGSHWDERTFYTETLSAFYSPEGNYFSPLTLALLEDSGWYKANYSNTRISPFGHGAGCDFVEKDCIVNDEIPDYAKGFFCNSTIDISSSNEMSYEYTCDPAHTHKAVCDLYDKGKDESNSAQYFKKNNLGVVLFERADYCPIALYQTIDCQKQENQFLNIIPDETFQHDSKCFNAMELENKGKMSLCLVTKCDYNLGVYEVHIRGSGREEEVHVCETDFQMIQFKSITGQNFEIECPRLAVMCPDSFCLRNCAGRGTCNYTGKPSCQCFDSADNTSDCSNTLIQEPNMNPLGKCYSGGFYFHFFVSLICALMSTLIL